jgi:TonB dependent receptor/Carboxypeptidase regulatory-like domain/TonB-dependent Receptor Plug Domain
MMGAQRLILAAMVLMLGANRAPAADELVTVRGRVSDAASGAPVAGAGVAAGETRGVTDASGSFTLTLARGRWTISVSAPNYLEQTRRVTVAEELPPPIGIALVPKARFSEHVDVKAAAPAGPGALPVAPERVLSVAGGLDNIFHVIQTLPGVVATDELGSRISVRGGGPDENLTIMDGVEIHNPYRLFGLTSAFNPETVARFDFSAGGFGVSHGDRLSSLLVVENRDGSAKKGLSGSSALSITDANVIFEGKLPVKKGSWLLTTRRTYYDLVAERFVDAQLPAFRDVQLRAVWEPKEGQKLALTGVRSREDGDGDFEGDIPDERGDFLLGVRNDLLSAAFQARVGPGLARTTLAWYGNTSLFDAAADFRPDTRRSNAPRPAEVPLTSIALELHHDIRDFSARQELSLPIGSRHSLETGVEVHRLRAGITYVFKGDRNPSAANGSSVQGGAGVPDRLESGQRYTRGGTWLEDRFRLTDALTVAPGLRLDASGMGGRAILSPRLSATLGLGRSTRLRAAAGRYTQSPGYEKLIVSDYLVDQVDLDFERARHFTLGVERDLFQGLAVRLDAYHKRFDRLIVGRLETEEERLARVARYDFPPALQSEIPDEAIVTSTPTNDGRGESYGLDLYVTRGGPRLSGWLSYTLGWARRQAYGRTYPFDYERRHSGTLVATYRFSPRFELAATARAASGFPRTPFVGLRVASTEADGRLVPERDGEGRLVYEAEAGGLRLLNSARLPFYARLDLRAAFRPRGENGRWQFYVEAINATRRKNTATVEATLEYDPDGDRPRLVLTRGGGVPFLPTFGVRFRF